MTIKTDLQVFYNQEAKKYYETRKKFWQEGSLILQTLKTLADTGKKLSILEIGCGSGRFANYLQQHYAGKFSYVGVDLSEKLLAYAKQDTPKLKFICEDMGEFIVRQKQESFDVIIGVASFQHIPSSRERLFLMKHFYRALRYDGLLIMTNRSLSHWFLQKHGKEIVHSFFRSLVSGGKLNRRDVYVPRISKGFTFKRYYHLFTLKELRTLTAFSGLQLRHLSYLDHKGNCIPQWKDAKNSFLVAQKSPILSILL